MALLLGTWVLASIILTPLIGYFLHSVRKPRRQSQRWASDARYRAPVWMQLPTRRQEYPRHNASFLKARRLSARGPHHS
jgi:predicted LPLAT superfamily acyltransferase